MRDSQLEIGGCLEAGMTSVNETGPLPSKNLQPGQEVGNQNGKL